MTSASNRPDAALPESQGSYASSIFKVIVYIFAVTLAVIALLHSVGMSMNWSETGSHIVGSFVYSTLIALPSMFLVKWTTQRSCGKFSRLLVLIQLSALFFTATAGCLLGGLIFILVGVRTTAGYWQEFRSSFEFAVIITLLFGMSSVTYETLRYKLQAATLELRTKQVEQERAYKLLAEARLSSLESRIHPHFLFNTLNSIAALIPSDPQCAEDTVGKLASLLRFSLSTNQSGLVVLRQELRIVRDYLEIEKTRFGRRLRYEIAVPDELAEVSVPPLALQSLAENAVKHVVAHSNQGASIRINGARDAGHIVLEVSDDGPGFTLAAITPEHGLGNLIARLELLFGGAGQLEVARESERTVVRLSFPA
jgi:two-component system, LytTR family, sensor histidine kinase AlgZ